MNSSKRQDVKRIKLQKTLGALPPAAIVGLDSGILLLSRTPWRKPRIRRVYDRIGFVGLGPIPSHFSKIHSSLAKLAHHIGDIEWGPEDVWCEDLADESSDIFATYFHNDSHDEVRYLFAEIMLAEISLEDRGRDYLAYITYDGRIVEASDSNGAIVVSGTAWKEDEDEDDDSGEGDTVQQKLARKVLGAFEEVWEPDADPRLFIDKYRELVILNGGILEIGWLDRGMVWEGNFDQVFNLFRETFHEGFPTMKHFEQDGSGEDESV